MAMGQARISLARWFGSASASSAYQLTNRLIIVASDHAHCPKRSDPIPSLDPSPYRVRMTRLSSLVCSPEGVLSSNITRRFVLHVPIRHCVHA